MLSHKPGEPEWCDAVDCSNHDAVKVCTVSCSEPEWCRFADCSSSRSKETCNNVVIITVFITFLKLRFKRHIIFCLIVILLNRILLKYFLIFMHTLIPYAYTLMFVIY